MGEMQKVLQDPEMLVQRYFANPRPDLKDMILVQFAPTVERIARRFSGIEMFEDLVQVGYIGLLNALKKFDPEAGVRFNTYATHLIAGEIKHYLRDKSQVIRHPAWLQELRHKVNRATLKLQAEFGRVPTPTEIAEELGVSESAIAEVHSTADLLKVGSFDAMLPGEEDGNEIDNMPACTNESMGVEDRLVLTSAMGQLRDLEREVLTAFHFESLSQTEIANRLGISCNYVSHILRQSLSKLRRILSNEEERDRMLKKQRQNVDEAVVDLNTGLYNEAYFKGRLEEEIHRAAADDVPVAVVVIKFEGLNGLQNYYGAESVRDFLSDAADYIKDLVRRLDVLCCYGKDGFGIILPMTGGTASVVKARLENRLNPWTATRRGPHGVIRATCGYSYMDGENRTMEELLNEACEWADPSNEDSQAA